MARQSHTRSERFTPFSASVLRIDPLWSTTATACEFHISWCKESFTAWLCASSISFVMTTFSMFSPQQWCAHDVTSSVQLPFVTTLIPPSNNKLWINSSVWNFHKTCPSLLSCTFLSLIKWTILSQTFTLVFRITFLTCPFHNIFFSVQHIIKPTIYNTTTHFLVTTTSNR